jgi:2'-5' RNA ligase
MRLFTGLSIPGNIATALESTLSELRRSARLRWSPVENLHITTKFIGEWPEERLAELRSTVAGVALPPPFAITVARLGFLPDARHPKIFLAGVHAEPGLAQLAERTEAALEGLGIKREARAFTPHLTLARIANEDITGLRERMAERPVAEFGSFTVYEFHLYLSQQTAAGSVYSVIGSWPLAKGPS